MKIVIEFTASIIVWKLMSQVFNQKVSGRCTLANNNKLINFNTYEELYQKKWGGIGYPFGFVNPCYLPLDLN